MYRKPVIVFEGIEGSGKSYHITNKKPQSKNNLKPNTISMFEKIYKCNKLKSDYEKQFNFKYDIVIRMRPDIMIYSDFDFCLQISA